MQPSFIRSHASQAGKVTSAPLAILCAATATTASLFCTNQSVALLTPQQSSYWEGGREGGREGEEKGVRGRGGKGSEAGGRGGKGSEGKGEGKGVRMK
jgi:hypothetical protein